MPPTSQRTPRKGDRHRPHKRPALAVDVAEIAAQNAAALGLSTNAYLTMLVKKDSQRSKKGKPPGT